MIIFSFPASLTASILGATLVVPTKSQLIADIKAATEPVLTGSVRGATFKGMECSLVDSLKAQPEAEQGADADAGLLVCDNGEVCVEDLTSSLGGRCVKFKDEELANEYDELTAVDTRHRKLADYTRIACTYADGSPNGVKCMGVGACAGIDPDKVQCGSCNGRWACGSMIGWTNGNIGRTLYVGELSCNGEGACYSNTDSSTVTIGSESCNQPGPGVAQSCYYGENNLYHYYTFLVIDLLYPDRLLIMVDSLFDFFGPENTSNGKQSCKELKALTPSIGNRQW
jgi:hypothetical protein